MKIILEIDYSSKNTTALDGLKSLSGAGLQYNIMKISRSKTDVIQYKSLLTVEKIVKIVTSGIGCSEKQPYADNRKRVSVLSRQLCMYFCRKYTDKSEFFISAHFGRDHSTVVHSVKQINNLIDTDKVASRMIKQIDNQLKIFTS